MKALVVEDDFTSRFTLETFLSNYGTCHIAANGKEAVDAFRKAHEGGSPYDLVCMDIRMPEMDGQAAMMAIRDFEQSRNVPRSCRAKIIITTAVDYTEGMSAASRVLCDAYLSKPFDLGRLVAQLKSFHFA